MTLTTAGGSGSFVLRPEDVQALVIQPLIRLAIATQVSSVVQTASHDTRFPIVEADPATEWTPEGEEITPDETTLNELTCTPKKLAGLTIVSSEMANDSDPSALEIVGQGLVRDVQLKLDAAYFGNTVANGPSGLLSLGSVQHVTAGSIADLDWAAEALSKAETVGSVVTSFVASPANVLAISTLKTLPDTSIQPLLGVDTSIQPLLGVDPSSPTKRSLFGVPPLYSSPAVDDDVIWAIPQAKTFVVIREGASVVTDTSAFFSSDRVGVRLTLRVGFAFPHEAAVVKIGVGGS